MKRKVTYNVGDVIYQRVMGTYIKVIVVARYGEYPYVRIITRSVGGEYTVDCPSHDVQSGKYHYINGRQAFGLNRQNLQSNHEARRIALLKALHS